MMVRALLVCLALTCLHCGGDEATDPGAGGTAGSAGTGGGAGSPPIETCRADALPGAVELGAWDDRFHVAGVGGPDGDAPHVSDFARDLDGSVLAAGRFRSLGDQSVEPLLRSQGSAWERARTSWELAPPEFGGFSAMAVGPAGELALATTTVAPEIWLDDGAGIAAIAELSGPSDFYQYVRSLVWFDGALWASGSFTLKGSGISHLAVWNGSAWQGPPSGDADGPVYDLLVSGARLYVAGGFDNVGGIAARRVAAWDGTSWEAFDMDFPHGGTVMSLAIGAAGKLVAGGTFSDLPLSECPTRGSVAEWDGSAWKMLGAGVSIPDVTCNGSSPGWVYDVAFHDGALYATGYFTHAGGAATDPSAVPVANFARFTNGSWQSLDGSAPVGVKGVWVTSGLEGFGFIGQRLFSDGDRLLAGILTPGAAGTPSQGLIAYDGTKWIAQGDSTGLALHADDARLAIGGPECALHAFANLTHAGSSAVDSPVVRFDGTNWTELGGALPEPLVCSRGFAVNAAGTAFVACIDDDTDRSEVLAQSGDAWTSIGSPHEGSQVAALSVDARQRLWAVGGVFGQTPGGLPGFVARYDDGGWTLLAEANAPVTHISFAPDDDGSGEASFVVAGSFTELGGAAHSRIARWDGSAWSSLGSGLTAPAAALHYGRNGIYASEESQGPPAALVVGKWDGAEWIELATAEHEFPELVLAGVRDLIEVGDALVVSGSLYRGEFPPDERAVLVFDGTRFGWLAGGLGASFLTSAVATKDALWFGGAIAEAGLGATRVSSVGIARFGWAN